VQGTKVPQPDPRRPRGNKQASRAAPGLTGHLFPRLPGQPEYDARPVGGQVRSTRPEAGSSVFGELLRGLAAAAAPASGRGSRRGRPGLLPERGQFGPGGVEVMLGALGAAAQLAA